MLREDMANVMQAMCGILSPWGNRSRQELLEFVEWWNHSLLWPFPCSSVGAAGGSLLHQWPPRAAGAQLPHHGPHHGIQGIFAPVLLCFFTNPGDCRAVSLTYSLLFGYSCSGFFPLWNMLSQKPPSSWMGLVLASLSGIDSASNRGSFWQVNPHL